jgi:hypothetical protein
MGGRHRAKRKSEKRDEVDDCDPDKPTLEEIDCYLRWVCKWTPADVRQAVTWAWGEIRKLPERDPIYAPLLAIAEDGLRAALAAIRSGLGPDHQGAILPQAALAQGAGS